MTRREKELDRQSQRLIRGAKHHHVSPEAMQIITDVLRAIAYQFLGSSYTILTARNGGWLVTTLSNRHFPEIEKRVVYIYNSYDAAKREADQLPDIDPICVEMDLLDILFQLLALPEVDSLIFFDGEGEKSQGKEVSRNDLQKLCEKQLQQSRTYLA